MAILNNTPKFFLTIFASPRHPESGFDRCTRGTLGEIDIFINDLCYYAPRKMILVARHRFVGSMHPIL